MCEKVKTPFSDGKVDLGRGQIRRSEPAMTVSSSLTNFGDENEEQSTQGGAEKIFRENENNFLKICGDYLQKTGRGISHKCIDHSANRRKSNIEALVKDLPDDQKLQIAGSIIKEQIQKNPELQKKNAELLLKSKRGIKRKIILNPRIEEKHPVSEEIFYNYQNNTGATSNEMKRLANFTRCVAGKKAVPIGIRTKLSEQGRVLENLYKSYINYTNLYKSKRLKFAKV